MSDKDPVLKSPAELRQLFTGAGVTGKKKAISYCEVGLQASYVYFLARYLGIDAAMLTGIIANGAKPSSLRLGETLRSNPEREGGIGSASKC